MAVTRENLLAAAGHKQVTAVEVDGVGEVFLRSPTFAEWYPLILDQAKYDGGPVPNDVIGRTLVACLCNEDGSRLLEDGDAETVLANTPAVVMALYNACKESLQKAVETREEVSGN
jgi:hypothetical protein